MRCPICESEHVQRLSIIHSGGLSNVDTSARGIGAGLGNGGIGVGIGAARVSGTQQTILSKEVAPPRKISWFNVSVLPVLGLLFGLAIHEHCIACSLIWTALVLVGSTYVWRGAWHYNAKIWPNEFEAWKTRFMCLRCGAVFAEPSKST